jgi:hypothetical protein
MCELGDEEMSLKTPIAREVEDKVFKHIGWYRDSKGYKHYGEIPVSGEDIKGRSPKKEEWLYKDTSLDRHKYWVPPPEPLTTK